MFVLCLFYVCLVGGEIQNFVNSATTIIMYTEKHNPFLFKIVIQHI